MRAFPRALAGALLMLLAGCATQSIRDSAPQPVALQASAEQLQAQRAQWLATRRDWRLVGRVAVSKAGKGGSGRMEWTQHGEEYSVALSAPITRQSWRLTGDTHSESGRIEGLDGGPREGPIAEDLLLEATGWEVPVNELPVWMLGFPAPGYPTEELVFGPDGRPARLRQAGWTIEYTRWSDPQGERPALPARIEASRDDAKVRLVVDEWDFTGS